MVVEGEQVALGDITAGEVGLVQYEVLCRRHYMRRMTSHAAQNAAASPEVLPFALDFCPIQPTTGNL
jgi:thymidine kinase